MYTIIEVKEPIITYLVVKGDIVHSSWNQRSDASQIAKDLNKSKQKQQKIQEVFNKISKSKNKTDGGSL